MINLLPDDTKRDIKAARMNILMLEYNVYTFLSILAIIGICAIFYVYLNYTQSLASLTSTENSAKASKLASVQKEADEYVSNLTTAKKIFDESINYTDVLLAITELIPAGVLLDSINLSAEQFGGPMQFAAHAKTVEGAAELKNNMQKSELFSDVQILSISDTSDGNDTSPSAYAVEFTLDAQISAGIGKW